MPSYKTQEEKSCYYAELGAQRWGEQAHNWSKSPQPRAKPPWAKSQCSQEVTHWRWVHSGLAMVQPHPWYNCTPTWPVWPQLQLVDTYRHAQWRCWGFVQVQRTWRSVWCFPCRDQAYSMDIPSSPPIKGGLLSSFEGIKHKRAQCDKKRRAPFLS